MIIMKFLLGWINGSIKGRDNSTLLFMKKLISIGHYDNDLTENQKTELLIKINSKL